MTTYSVHLIDENGKGSYLSVKGKSEWKTKKTARKHARDIAATKHFGKFIIEIENEFGELIETIL